MINRHFIITNPNYIYDAVPERWCAINRRVFRYKAYARRDLSVILGVSKEVIKKWNQLGTVSKPIFISVTGQKARLNRPWKPAYLYDEVVCIVRYAVQIYKKRRTWVRADPLTVKLNAELREIREDIIRRIINEEIRSFS